MISSDFITELAQFCIETVSQDAKQIASPPEKLFEKFTELTQGPILTVEERRKWLLHILRDLQMRQGRDWMVWDFITNDILEEVNFQLRTSRIHLYTLIPVNGLQINMDFSERLEITDKAIVRKIASWEWERYFRFLRGVKDTLPSIGLEYVRSVEVDELLEQYHDDDHFGIVMRDIRSAATALQTISTQGMHFPWMIQYVPECQFTFHVGNINTTMFDTTPSNRPMTVFAEADVKAAYELHSKQNALPSDLKSRFEVASRRFHEAANKSNPLDRIVDHWIVAESLFGEGEDNDARQVACRLVCFLFANLSQQERRDAFIWVMKFWYPIRCKIVHGTPHDEFFTDFALAEQSREIIRRALLKVSNISLPAVDLFREIARVSAKTDLPNATEIKSLKLSENVMTSIYKIIQNHDEL